MRQPHQASVTCQSCDRVREVPAAATDAVGGEYTCRYCRRDIPTPEDMRHEEPDSIRT
ncbi:hypothetical protein RYH80_17855 [Halobaculum sp. MBLA0147]|uniref:hypothetical protein n=1 Tax=Halobaculum sp. MBLA0147 TaxID=3079934 RepID=UPI0035264B4F